MRPNLAASDVSVTAGPSSKGEMSIKIQAPPFEVNIWVPCADISKFDRVLSTTWDAKSLQIGESAGAPVHWSKDNEGWVSILIGHDDETWDIGLFVPVTTISDIIRELQQASGA
jgi:hypothetical protein